MVDIRRESPADHDSVLHVQREAFGREAEAALVDRLRREQVGAISLVARPDTAPQGIASAAPPVDSAIVGHVLFSEAELVIGSAAVRIGALGPLAVLSSHRRRGIAEALVRDGLRFGWQRGWPAVIVVGDPAYYRRFGFERADTWSIRCALDVPAAVFMIAFAREPLRGPATAHYHPAFAGV